MLEITSRQKKPKAEATSVTDRKEALQIITPTKVQRTPVELRPLNQKVL
jgi:hypothetical protein